ncbi:hypothetical protein HYH03_007763 [Edaphochlamys debaryana]|uniref:Protein kinase domain-containing protein n=1 Tax=Edaphochlamys debaryana TaxID=47281 RepID=A0A836BYZ7_9CHLO|nr:hypothetical protein HYH03_007763 [Edaphochlamys debaryana]|eukprot:KAG2494125.1 hypothetical protein HYH03_007763 [Edaphochlamys debaryana]
MCRAHATLALSAAATGSREARLFGVNTAGAEGFEAASCLIHLASSSAASSLDAPPTTASQAGAAASLMPGHRVLPASAHAKQLRASGPQAQDLCGPASSDPLDLLPALFERMLQEQAPVFRATGTGAAREVVALVPLSAGQHITGALWLAHSGRATSRFQHRLSTGPGSIASSSTATAATTAAAAACPSLLTDPLALQQLGLIVSLVLLAGDSGREMAALCEGLHALSTAASMQQLVGRLCGALETHVRRRYLLDPRVVAALVPEQGSAVGLMFSCGGGQADRSVGTTAGRPAGMASPKPMTGPRSGLRRANTSTHHGPVPAAMSPLSQGTYEHHTESGYRSQRVTGLVAAAADSTAAAACASHDGPRSQGAPAPAAACRPQSDSRARNPQHQLLPTASSLALGAQTPQLSEAAAGAFRSGTRAGMSGAGPRVVALSQNDLAAVAASVAASGTFAPALHVKPFPLAQTLLKHLARKPCDGGLNAAGAGAPANGVSTKDLAVLGSPSKDTAKAPGGGASAAAPVASGGATATASKATGVGGRSVRGQVSTRAKPQGLVVEDCAVHVQDPRRPARDILLLMAGAGLQSAPSPLDSLGAIWNSPGCPSGGAGRGVRSLLLLVLPAQEYSRVLGFYVAFQQSLPQPLLQEARDSLLELLEVASPLVSSKLQHDLAMEVETLATATPGSYAVVEDRSPLLPPDGCVYATAPAIVGAVPTDPESCRVSFSKLPDRDRTEEGRDRLEPLLFSSLGPSFLLDSRGTHGATAVRYSNLAMGYGSSGGNHIFGAGSYGAPALLDTADHGSLLPGVSVGVGSTAENVLAALAVCGVATSGRAPGGEGSLMAAQPSSVVHVEEINAVNSTLRSQMPLLVASLQNSIGIARAEAAAAAAAAMSMGTGSRRFGREALGQQAGKSCDADDNAAELERVELVSQLGHGGCAVVFKGRMGVMDVAVKLMEMPNVDDDSHEHEGPSSAPGAAPGGRHADADRDAADSWSTPASGSGDPKELLAARRALLRNAMELATMTSLTGHPNIMQVYSCFSNVTLGRRPQPDGSMRFYLKHADGAPEPAELAGGRLGGDAAPVCMALVCEWCDRACLATALCNHTFPGTVTRSQASPPAQNIYMPPPQRALNYKVILMTLLDVVLALRHLHSHNLIHRDIKPANVLLRTSNTDPRGFTAKLADFGFVTLLNQASTG